MRERLVRLVTHRRRLNELYGDGYFDHLLRAIDNWKNALALEGLLVEEPFVLSDEFPCDDMPGALKERLARLNRKPADAVVILGGPQVVPFFPICSPEFLVPADGDAHILSDDPYVAFDRHNVLYKPECPVGRLPDGGAGHPALLMDLITRATAHHRGQSPATPVPLGLTSATWRHEAGQIFSFPGNSLYACPPHGSSGQPCVNKPITPEWLQPCNLHYYNVHGTPSNMRWYGQCDVNDCRQRCDHPYIALLDADKIPALSDAWVFSEASYSAHVTSAAEANLALRFLKQGAVCYVGTTATAYGANPRSSLGAADRIAQTFIDGVRRNMEGAPLSIGEILKRAKLDFQVRDNFDRKTVVEFVLLGDPTLIPFRTRSY